MRTDFDHAQQAGPLYVSLFGRFRVHDGCGAEIDIRSRHARALLAMLSIAQEPLERDFVSKILWPGRFPSQAKASLRQCIFELGRQLKEQHEDHLEITRSTVALRPGAIVTDFDTLIGRLVGDDPIAAAESLEQAGRSKFLEQLDLGEEFAQWCESHSRDVERRIGSAVDAACKRLAARGEADCRNRLMLAHDGRTGARASNGNQSAAAQPRRVAVLPFELVSCANDHSYFADGLVAELITVLNRIPGLQVAGRTSSFHFRASSRSIREIASILQVTHLIEGTVQREGDAVRIFVRLIDGSDGFETWSGIYSGTLENIFALQESVANAVTVALSEHFGCALAAPLVKVTTNSQLAYDLYLRGRDLGARMFGTDVLGQARDLLERSVAIDPDFAEAWLALAEVHHNTAVYTQCIDRPAAMDRMAGCARKALELDDDLNYARSLLGTYQFTVNNLVGAIELALEAHRRGPDHPEVAMRVASFLLYCGLTSQAEPYVLEAVARDPVDPRKYALISSMLLAQGDLRGAQAAGQKMVDMGWPSMFLAIASAALGEHDRAVEEYQITKRLMNTMILPPVGIGPSTPAEMDAYWLVAAKGVCSGQESDRIFYGHLLEHLYATLPDKADNAICGPAVYTGNPELVFKSYCLRFTAANILQLMLMWTDVDPMRRIWKHPEFPDFALRTGMIAAWEKFGWPDLLHNDRARFQAVVVNA